MKSSDWLPLGSVDPHQLADVRLAVHYAAQPIAAAAWALLPEQADHSHSNLLWSPEHRRFVGRILPGGNRVFLDVAGFRAGVLDANGVEAAVVEPAGKTLRQLFDKMAEALRATGEQLADAPLALPDYELPATFVAEGGPFPVPDPTALEELTRWFHNGFVVLSHVADSQLDGAEVRVWPHHSDMAALLTLDSGPDTEDARSVGIGLSPGDSRYCEPYFYVSPWPYPDKSDLPPLPDGTCWHTEEFTAAVLTGTELVSAADGEAQYGRARGFLGSTVSACRALLDRSADQETQK